MSRRGVACRRQFLQDEHEPGPATRPAGPPRKRDCPGTASRLRTPPGAGRGSGFQIRGQLVGQLQDLQEGLGSHHTLIGPLGKSPFQLDAVVAIILRRQEYRPVDFAGGRVQFAGTEAFRLAGLRVADPILRTAAAAFCSASNVWRLMSRI